MKNIILNIKKKNSLLRWIEIRGIAFKIIDIIFMHNTPPTSPEGEASNPFLRRKGLGMDVLQAILYFKFFKYNCLRPRGCSNLKSIVLLVLILSFYSKAGNAQSTEELPEIKVIARAQEDQILLRWSLNTPISWKKGNRYGYTLERYTISRDRQTLAQPEKVIIGQRFMPAPMMEWEMLAEESDQGAIMAQALWGESFVVEGGGGLASVINRAEEQQQRFAFALYAADQNFHIAQKAGLGYVDTTVQPNEKYLYKVVANIPETELKTKEGGVYIGIMDYEPLPEPVDFVGVFQDQSTLLSWNSKILKNTYNAYSIERSEDGSNFRKLSSVPYATLTRAQEKEAARTLYIDSIANSQNYYYRIKGITSFGETGPASAIVTGTGKSVLKYVPHLISKKLLSQDEVELIWEFPEQGTPEITGFSLKRANTAQGVYMPVVTNIPPTARRIRYDKLRASNYFKITAIGKENNQRDSFSMLVQPIDSIPPKQPEGLTGTVDSTGVVQLQWTPNTEEDIQGYRIYRGNRKNEEYSQLTEAPYTQTKFTDTVPIANMGSKVYYQLIAVDRRYNMSKPSAILELTKPDVVPPTMPVFTSYAIVKGHVQLEWANSSSVDVEGHYIYRKGEKDANWNLVHQSPKSKNSSYTDKNVEAGNYYNYTVIARDESGLESAPAPPVSVIIPKSGLREGVKGFYANVNQYEKTIVLSWRFKGIDISGFELYRAVDDKPSTLYKVLPPQTQLFTDTKLTINTTYKYIIRVVYNDGSYSEYSSTKVTY
ncbi:hypothetical protein [Aquimarina brevivitae]|uniref:hypothetical protein n=1 Tax=Aquimarina brevivitae TaxID=323412 RepID=UPI00102A62FD|nr:hypothetical protein [Aquimarina brevivitae]